MARIKTTAKRMHNAAHQDIYAGILKKWEKQWADNAFYRYLDGDVYNHAEENLQRVTLNECLANIHTNGYASNWYVHLTQREIILICDRVKHKND